MNINTRLFVQTEDTKDEDEEETTATRRLMNLPREDLASLTCRTGFTSEEIRRLYRAFKQQVNQLLGIVVIKIFNHHDSLKKEKIVHSAPAV